MTTLWRSIDAERTVDSRRDCRRRVEEIMKMGGIKFRQNTPISCQEGSFSLEELKNMRNIDRASAHWFQADKTGLQNNIPSRQG